MRKKKEEEELRQKLMHEVMHLYIVEKNKVVKIGQRNSGRIYELIKI